MKKNQRFIEFSIIILIILIIFQFFFLYSKTIANTILNYGKTTFENDTNYLVLENLTKALLETIPEKENKNITLLFNEETSPYSEFGIGYLYIRYLAYPMQMNTGYQFYFPISEQYYLNEKIQKENLDYILLLGKNTELFNQISTKDYTLYKVTDKKNNQIKEISSINFGLYDIYKNINTEEEQKKYNEIIKKMKVAIEEYWSFSSIDLMREFAIDLYENEEYDLAIEYSNYYLNTVDYINVPLNMNLADIYTKQGNFELAISHYQACQRNQECDSVLVQQKINELMLKEVK